MKTWGEMSDAEQGALLLAHHRGEVIEGIDPDSPEDEWEVPRDNDVWGLWQDDLAYRVKKEPVVEVRVQTAKVVTTLGHDCLGQINVYQDFDATCTYTDGKLTKIHWEAE